MRGTFAYSYWLYHQVIDFRDIFSYAANKAANKYIFNRSDVVSAIGAFVVGLLGNIYSRLCGGTAFQVMSVGVSFLIPVSLNVSLSV